MYAISGAEGACPQVGGSGRMSPWTLEFTLVGVVFCSVNTSVLIAFTSGGGTGEISAIFGVGGFCRGRRRWTHVTMDSGLHIGGTLFSRHSMMRVNSTNVQYEGLRIGGIGRWMNLKVKSVKQGVYQK
jgi:hypothetical protein